MLLLYCSDLLSKKKTNKNWLVHKNLWVRDQDFATRQMLNPWLWCTESLITGSVPNFVFHSQSEWSTRFIETVYWMDVRSNAAHLFSRSNPRSESKDPNRLRSWLYGYSVKVHFFIAGSSLTPGHIFSVGVPSSYKQVTHTHTHTHIMLKQLISSAQMHSSVVMKYW